MIVRGVRMRWSEKANGVSSRGCYISSKSQDGDAEIGCLTTLFLLDGERGVSESTTVGVLQCSGAKETEHDFGRFRSSHQDRHSAIENAGYNFAELCQHTDKSLHPFSDIENVPGPSFS